MGKKLAIRGHLTRGKEVIELLEMMGGKSTIPGGAILDRGVYTINEGGYISEISPYNIIFYDFTILTLEEFLEKYPFKVGDKVQVLKSGKVFTIGNMIWDDEVCNIYYYNTDDIEYYNAEELKLYKETDTVKPVTNKSERTHEDVIFDSIIWHLRNSVNNGKQNLSGGECEDYFREVVKKNNENKMSDCKKCGLGFGSVQCFDKDCPHNTPKSNAVGLKDGKVTECGVNKEIVMNENNREVINMTKETITPAPDITANITDKNNCDIECYQCPDGYEFYDENGNLIGNKVMMRPIKPKYPTTYVECKEMLPENVYYGYSRFMTLQKLIICRDVYWKIYGEQMGLTKPWKPDWEDETQVKYMITTFNNELKFFSSLHSYVVGRRNHILSFPSEKMRDAFYENFKKEIEQCKELL